MKKNISNELALNEDLLFECALRENNKETLKQIRKVDIHNHASYSCRKKYLEQKNIVLGKEKVKNIDTLIEFSRKYITPLKKNVDGLEILLKGTFENCINTGVTVVSTSIDFKDCIRTFGSNIDEFINFLKKFNYKNLKISWVLEISRDSYKEEYKDLIINLINTKYFSGIDLVSTENCISNLQFIDFYKLANELHLTTKVHAGEQLGADYVRQCIIDFETCKRKKHYI